MSDTNQTIWSWQHGFMQSDLPSTTRLVLFVLCSHINAVGESCFPSIERIMCESRLSKMSVCKHLRIAEKAGWIQVSQHGFKGQKWRRNEYKPTFQGLHQGAEPPSVPQEKGGKPSVPACSEGGKPNNKKVVKEVYSSRPLELTTEEKENKKRKNGSICFIRFWETYPRKRGKKPSRDKWRSKGLDAKIDMILVDIQNRITNDERWKDGFIPDPATYLSQERWDDELTGGNHGKNRKLCAVDRVIAANVKRLQELGDLPTPSEQAGNSGSVCQLFPHVSG